MALLRDGGGPISRDKNLPPEIILDPLQTNMRYDSNSGCLTFIAVIWKKLKTGAGSHGTTMLPRKEISLRHMCYGHWKRNLKMHHAEM